MSVVTKEEIDEIINGFGVGFAAHGREHAMCERVAALVEQRLREIVCTDCGSTDPSHPLDKNCPLWDRGWFTRAQYEAEREGK